MKLFNKNAKITGILFLIAMFASLIGGAIIESVLSVPEKLEHIYNFKNQVYTGVFLEMINGIAVIGIAVAFYPVLKRLNESLAIGYFGFRIIEAICCILIVISPLAILELNGNYPESGIFNFDDIIKLLIEVRNILTGLLIGIFFSLGALLLYYLLYRSKLIPGFISIWGLIAVILVLIVNLAKPGIPLNIILVLPIILNEIFMGIWLIVKGFNNNSF